MSTGNLTDWLDFSRKAGLCQSVMQKKKTLTPPIDTRALLCEHLARCGAKGGKSRSKKKMAAMAANLAKAQANRWKKRKAA